MNIIKYKIQKRKYSSNAIVGVYIDEKGKQHKEVMVVVTGMKKSDGDIQANTICHYLNVQITMSSEYPF